MKRLVKLAGLGCGGLLAVTFLLVIVSVIVTPRSPTTPTPGTEAAAKPVATLAPQPTTPIPPSPTKRPVPTATPVPQPTAPLSPEEALGKVASDHFRENFKAAKLTAINLSELERLFSGTPAPTGTATPQPNDRFVHYATVDFDLGPQWDENSAVRSAATSLKQFGPKAFEIQLVGTLELRAFSDFKDAYGDTKSDVAVKFTMSRSVAQKANWKEIDPRNFAIILTGDDGGVYIHPALRKAWADYTRR